MAATTVVAVTHNSAGAVGDMLITVPEDLPVIVVDNGSQDGTPDVVRRARPTARVIENDNVGYGAGVNEGLAAIATPFALIVGPDVALTSETLEKLCATARAYPQAALVAPQIRNPDGTVELSHDVMLERRSGYPRRDGEPAPDGAVCADFLSGAVWLARMDALKTVGGFDEAIFLYYEDDDLCRRLRNAGYSLILEPAAVAAHIGGGSVPLTTAYSRLKYWHMGWSRLYFAKKHAGDEAARREFWLTAPRLILKAGFYALVGKSGKARRDFARVAGMRAMLAGRPALSTVPAGPRKAT